MVVYDRSVQSAVIIDGRETAPGRMTHDLFMDLRSKNGKTSCSPIQYSDKS